MNSETLKSENKKDYEVFFNKYDLIVSCPIIFSLTWINTWFTTWNSFEITQKIWLRNYIWINTQEYDKDIEFIYKDNSIKEFEKSFINKYYPVSRQFFDDIGLKHKIWFLSEYNWIDYLISKLLLDNGIKTSEIDDLDIKNIEHQKIMKKIIKLDNKLLNELNFFWSLRNSNCYLWGSILKSESNIFSLENNFDTTYMNISNNKTFQNLDLSFYIINPNIFTKPIFQSDFLFEESEKIQKIWKKYNIDIKKNNLVECVDYISRHYSLETLQNLNYLYEKNQKWNDFFKNISIFNNLSFTIYRNHYKNLLKHSEIKKILRRSINNKDIEIAITQSWNRIQIFWNNPLKIDKKNIEEINSLLWYNFTLDYSSNNDWFEINWVKIEQWKSKWIFSEFSSEYIIKNYSSKWVFSEWFDYITDINDILKKNNRFILDTVSNKIFFNGKKITSQDLHSQSWTIDILKLLLNIYWEDVSNKKLWQSSYSKNKNEMIWKIIIPFIKLFEKKTWEKLQLICKWSIYDFYLKIKLSKSPISIIEKI